MNLFYGLRRFHDKLFKINTCRDHPMQSSPCTWYCSFFLHKKKMKKSRLYWILFVFVYLTELQLEWKQQQHQQQRQPADCTWLQVLTTCIECMAIASIAWMKLFYAPHNRPLACWNNHDYLNLVISMHI